MLKKQNNRDYCYYYTQQWWIHWQMSYDNRRTTVSDCLIITSKIRLLPIIWMLEC